VSHEEHVAEVIIHDEVARLLAHLFLPVPGSHLDAAELADACARLAEAARTVKLLAAKTARVM
jgi:hypothetical protein